MEERTVIVCVVLADSAETVAESTGNPELRNATFDFVNKIRKEVQLLCKIYREIQAGAHDSSVIERVKSSVRRIKDLMRETQATTSSADNTLRRRILDEAKSAANSARAVLVVASSSFDSFWPSVQNFSSNCLVLYKSLVELENQQFNPIYKLKLSRAYEDLRRVSVQYVRVASAVYEQPKNKDLYRDLDAMASELAKRIAAAISIAQPGGEQMENKIRNDRKVLQLSAVDDQTLSSFVADNNTSASSSDPQNRGAGSAMSRNRNRTVAEPNQGAEILARARVATVTHDIYTELSKAAVMPAEPQPDAQRSNVRDKVTYFMSLMDQQMRNASASQTAAPTTTSLSNSADKLPASIPPRFMSPQRVSPNSSSNSMTVSLPQTSPRTNTPTSVVIAEHKTVGGVASPARSPRLNATAAAAVAASSSPLLTNNQTLNTRDPDRIAKLEHENQQLRSQLRALQIDNERLREENQKLTNSKLATTTASSTGVSPREKKSFF